MTGSFDILTLSDVECWVLGDLIRRHDALGQEWDRDFMRRLYRTLAEAEAAPSKAAQIMVTEDELWQIDRQINSAIVVGPVPVGRNILRKVRTLLVKLWEDDDGRENDGGNDTADGTNYARYHRDADGLPDA